MLLIVEVEGKMMKIVLVTKPLKNAVHYSGKPRRDTPSPTTTIGIFSSDNSLALAPNRVLSKPNGSPQRKRRAELDIACPRPSPARALGSDTTPYRDQRIGPGGKGRRDPLSLVSQQGFGFAAGEIALQQDQGRDRGTRIDAIEQPRRNCQPI